MTGLAQQVRDELEALHAELCRDTVQVRSGLKAHQAGAAISARHQLPAERATLEALRRDLAALPPGEERRRLRRLFFACVDAHLQWQLAPLDEAIDFVLSSSAVELAGRRVHYHEATPWLQREPSAARRAELGRGLERLHAATNPLALRLLTDQDRLLAALGFGGYLGYCRAKKGLDYPAALPGIAASLDRTEAAYFERMGAWAGADLGVPLEACSRLDCIHLLKLARFDAHFSPRALRGLPAQLSRLGLSAGHPHLRLDLAARRRKNPQAVCLGVRIPQEVHLIVKPQGGLLDAETLLHELGHALHLAHFDPHLPFEDRYLPRGRALSEAFAFLLQGLLGNAAFLGALGMEAGEAEALRRARRLRDLALWRRYGAKLLAEVEMWGRGGPDGGALYSATMTRHTGFRYEPSGYLADMEPEFYAADYLRAWMAEAQLSARLTRQFGEAWPLDARSGEFLISLWRQGERHSLEEVLEGLGERPGDLAPLEARLLEP